MIERGNQVPSVPIKLVTRRGVEDVTSDAALGGSLVVMFTVPGAFTPTCHVHHLPGFLANAAKLRGAGVDSIVCASLNDHHVMKAWAEASNALGDISFLADGNGALAAALGLEHDRSASWLGIRYARSAIIIRDGVVDAIFVEDAPGVGASGAPAILTALANAS